MKKVVHFAFISSSFFISHARADSTEVKVIYGKDNRKEVSRARPWVQGLAQSTATLIAEKEMTRDAKAPGVVRLNQKSLKEWLETKGEQKINRKLFSDEIVEASNAGVTFCDGERFVNQPNPGVCSGFLIAPDLLATAGHCLEIENFCADYRWVFDFKVDGKTGKAGLDVKEENIYKCKKVVSSALSKALNLDYAVIQLDRFVVGRRPLKINSENTIGDGTKIVMIGSPSGLPLKVTAGAAVRTNKHPFFFSANLDAFQGNSGSAVFNASTGVVEGILVRGEDDFVQNPLLMCIEANRCEDKACRGEDVSRMTSIPEVAVMKMLFASAFEGDLENLQKVLKLNLWVDFYDMNRQSALMKAAKGGQAKALTLLLTKGADVNLIDVNGNTALHHLAATLSAKNAEALDVLLTAKAGLEVKNFAGESPLKVAGRLKNLEGARLFIRAGADKNTINKLGETILFDFAKEGPGAELREMLDLGVSPELENNMGLRAI
ncbi:MAG TPA: ankyrin repeat domain-containing protein [Bacteriovoracaceae bacterium]|nr:ankyrin repeat domain-containing protein [Bacteriovoracaceae bacterium]